MFLGLDFGTSAVKALLVDGEQTVVASATVPLSVQRPAVGHSEQDPQAWWQAMLDAVDASRARSCRARCPRLRASACPVRCTAPSCWTRPAASCVPPSCGTMSVRPPNAPNWRRLFPLCGR